MLDEAKLALPTELRIPDNFTYEKMIYEIAMYYGMDPKNVESSMDVYDYYEHLVFKIHKHKTEEYLYRLSKGNDLHK